MEMIMGMMSAWCGVVLLFYVWRVMEEVWFKPKNLEKSLRRQGFAGNPYKFLQGESMEMKKRVEESRSRPITLDDDIKKRLVHFPLKTIHKYGNACFFWIGSLPTVIIPEPELMKEVMSKMNVYHRPKFTNPLVKLLTPGILRYESHKWTKHRKIVTPAFRIDKLKMMMPAFRLSCGEVLSAWDEITSSDVPTEVDVWPHIQNLTCDAISRTAFGSSYLEGTRIFQLLKEQNPLLGQLVRSIYFPGMRFLPNKRNRRIKEIEAELHTLIRSIIDKRVEAMNAGEACNDDLLSIMLESNFQEIKENGDKSYGMSIDEVVEECKVFYLAGKETTSSLLIWTIILLSQHTEWQTRARQEVLQVLGDTRLPEFEDLNQFKIVTMIFHEVLRLYTPVVSLARRVTEDVELGKFTLPAGTNVSIPVMLFHHDPRTWGHDASKFRPDRFSEGVAKAQKNPGIFLPFGWGPRNCIGQTFSMMEAKVTLSMILQRFTLELSPSYKHAPMVSLFLQPQHGAHLMLRKRY